MNSKKYLNGRTKILFVDDMSVCCRIFMKGLSGGYSTYWAKNREEALRQVKKENYDLVITDYHLGDEAPKGGLDVIAESCKQKIPVISISKDQHKNEALDSGANKFVFKREFFDNVEKTIMDVLKNGRQER
jgi:CheY-like chemotaxis protein